MNNDKLEVSRELLLDVEYWLKWMEAEKNVGGRCSTLKELRALLANTATQYQGDPVALTAVGILRDDGDGGLAPEWTLEGGTSELWVGAVLLIADENQELCAEDGHCELYRCPAEQPTPVAVVLPERSNERDHAGDWTYEAKAWNACLDEVTRINTK